MKLVIVSQYFWPENFIINELVTKLVESGHEVTVLTGKPNYPGGEFFSGYRSWGVVRETYHGVDIVRIPMLARGKGGAKGLVGNYLSFAIVGSLLFPWLCRKKKVDAIFVFAPSPVTMAIPAVILKWIKRTKLTLWIQDLWPESLSSTGFVKNKFLLNIVSVMVRWIYAQCDRLLVQSKGFVEPVARLSNREKILYYPNSVDGSLYTTEGNESPPVEIAGLLKQMAGRFSVVFAGNIGTAQSVETIVGAANLLAVNAPSVQIVIVGSGSRRDWVVEQVDKLKLDNVLLPGRFDVEMMPHILSRADALLVTLKDEEIFSYTIPSKVQAYLAMGKPIIAALNGEGARVIEESKAGFSCAAENYEDLANLILNLSALSVEERSEMGRLARLFFEEHFDMDKMVSTLEEILEK